MAPPSPDLILPLLLLLLVSSSGAEPYPLALVPQRCSPSSSAAYWLGPAIESHDPGARPLPDGTTWWLNQRSSRLLHRLLRTGGVLEPEGPASLEGNAGSGSDAAREGVGEVGSVVPIRGDSGPWGQPRGPMELCVVWWNGGAPMGLVTTVMQCSSSSSSPPSAPDGLMVKAREFVQPDWGTAPNRGWHTAGPNDPMERRRGPTTLSAGTLAGLGKGMGAAPTLDGVARSKAAAVVVM
jgi:hypothetical protein